MTMRGWLYAVAYRYGVAEVMTMDFATLGFWYKGHLELTEAEESAAERMRKN